MITWMKNVNNFQVAKIQPRGVALPCIIFPNSALLIKKSVYSEKTGMQFSIAMTTLYFVSDTQQFIQCL